MALSGIEIARRDNGRIIIRPGGVRVRWELPDLTSSDGHSVRGVFRAAVRALDEPAERKMLEEVFLTGDSAVTSAEVVRYFSSALESLARRQVGTGDAQTILSDAGKSLLLSKLGEAARSVAFGCGLELLAPFELDLDSPTLRQAQQEHRRAASQSQRLTQAASLFKQFQEIRQSAPDLPAEKIMQRMGLADPAEQTDLLRSLLLSAARQTQPSPLWAVAGPHLIRIEPADLESGTPPVVKIFTPPSLLGPFRSVQRAQIDGKVMLLLGARSGVLLIDPQSPEQAILFADPGVTSSLGFNAAAISGNKIWATHGEAGLVGWDMENPTAPLTAIRPAIVQEAPLSPRNLCRLSDERLIFSSDHRLFELTEDRAARQVDGILNAPILAIVAQSGENLLIIHEDGELCRRDARTLAIASRTRRSGKLLAAGGLPWLGDVRLLLATEQGPVLCVGIEDELVTQYVSPHTGLRLTAASADRVAAVSGDRQRILLWPSWDGRKPPTEIHIGALAKHRVADVEFA
jgi:hypothetical protein